MRASSDATPCPPTFGCFGIVVWAWFPELKKRPTHTVDHSIDGLVGIGAALDDWARAHITPVMLADVACRTFAKQLTPNIKARGAHGHSSVSLAVRWGPYLCAGDLETSQHKARKESRAALASIPAEGLFERDRTSSWWVTQGALHFVALLTGIWRTASSPQKNSVAAPV